MREPLCGLQILKYEQSSPGEGLLAHGEQVIKNSGNKNLEGCWFSEGCGAAEISRILAPVVLDVNHIKIGNCKA